MTAPAPRSRRRLAALALCLPLALGACTGPGASPATQGPETVSGPVGIAHAGSPVEAVVAEVLARHLRNRGHDATAQAPVAEPWTAGGSETIAVVDTLSFALEQDLETVLPAPPEPTAEPSPEDGAPEDEADPREPGTDEDASADGDGVGGPASPSPTPSPERTVLPSGRSAANAEQVEDVLERHLAEAGGQEAGPSADPDEGGASPDSTPGAVDPAGSAETAAPPSEQRVLASAPGPLRLRAAVTAASGSLLDLDSVQDLNARCEPVTAAAPSLLTSAEHPAIRDAFRTRLDRLAGCRPQDWAEPDSPVGADVVADHAQLGFLYGIQPEIEANALKVLDDPGRILPEGRLSVVGAEAALPGAVVAELRDVVGRLDEDALRALLDVSTGTDGLSTADAAQYWLVSEGLEDAPEGWYMPPTEWF